MYINIYILTRETERSNKFCFNVFLYRYFSITTLTLYLYVIYIVIMVCFLLFPSFQYILIVKIFVAFPPLLMCLILQSPFMNESWFLVSFPPYFLFLCTRFVFCFIFSRLYLSLYS